MTHPFKKRIDELNTIDKYNRDRRIKDVSLLNKCPICDRDYLVHGLCYTCGYGMSEGQDDSLFDDDILNNYDSELLDIDFFSM